VIRVRIADSFRKTLKVLVDPIRPSRANSEACKLARIARAGDETVLAVGCASRSLSASNRECHQRAPQSRSSPPPAARVADDVCDDGDRFAFPKAVERQARHMRLPTLSGAARLQAIAASSPVVIAEGTGRLLGNVFELEDFGAKSRASPAPSESGRRYSRAPWTAALRRRPRPA